MTEGRTDKILFVFLETDSSNLPNIKCDSRLVSFHLIFHHGDRAKYGLLFFPVRIQTELGSQQIIRASLDDYLRFGYLHCRLHNLIWTSSR